jgi:hypothetical protein
MNVDAMIFEVLSFDAMNVNAMNVNAMKGRFGKPTYRSVRA